MTMVRRVYAKQIAHAAGAEDSRLEAALADLPRERFLPDGPWHLRRWLAGSQVTPDDDPIYLYQDVPVAIRPAGQLNNGQPSFVAGLIAKGRPRPGDVAVHIGTGTGYFTALIARLVSPGGRVLGIEHDASLAAWASDAVAEHTSVETEIVAGDGLEMPLPAADLVFVNAGAARPAATWLDALNHGGRLILPLTVPTSIRQSPITQGVVFLIERRDERYDARCLSTTVIYPCIGAQDPEASEALSRALAAGAPDKVTTLLRTDDIEESRCWLRGPGWCFAYG